MHTGNRNKGKVRGYVYIRNLIQGIMAIVRWRMCKCGYVKNKIPLSCLRHVT